MIVTMSDPTQPTEGSLASDATVDADSHAPSPPSGSSIIRTGGLPKQFGRYRVLGVLGRGGMGAVYQADDPELGRRVAIKVLREDLATADRDALRREAQALARLVHPNVIAVYDVGESGERVFLVMQLVDGVPIDQRARPRMHRVPRSARRFARPVEALPPRMPPSDAIKATGGTRARRTCNAHCCAGSRSIPRRGFRR